MRYLIKFSYDGTNFNGYQRQPKLRTVQDELEKALTIINNQKTNIYVSGRTDRGVHATEQYGHVDLAVSITSHKLKRAMNSNLPQDIHVINTELVNDNFFTRFAIKYKQYKYLINLGEYNPLTRNYIYQYGHNLDIEKMKEAVNYYIGEHDFRAFVTENNNKENCIRTIYKTKIELKKDILSIHFIGNGFMKYQVRNMVGLLIKIGEGKLNPDIVLENLESKNRGKNSYTAPSNGLYLEKVMLNVLPKKM